MPSLSTILRSLRYLYCAPLPRLRILNLPLPTTLEAIKAYSVDEGSEEEESSDDNEFSSQGNTEGTVSGQRMQKTLQKRTILNPDSSIKTPDFETSNLTPKSLILEATKEPIDTLSNPTQSSVLSGYFPPIAHRHLSETQVSYHHVAR